MTERMAVFGDVHGRSDMLKALHNKVKFIYGNDIPMQSCGDLIDRGPDSSGVIQYCIDNNIDAVIGNHDEWLRKLGSEMMFDTFSMDQVMGGVQTAQSYGSVLAGTEGNDNAIGSELYSLLPKEHIEWLENQPFYRKVTLANDEVYWILHAGLTEQAAAGFYNRFNSDDEVMNHLGSYENTRDLLIWGRPRFPLPSNYDKPRVNGDNDLYHFKNDATQIFGHTIRETAFMDSHYIAIDTGCGTKTNGQKLTAVIIPDRIFITITEDDLEEWLEK
jgi:hypothetical protein